MAQPEGPGEPLAGDLLYPASLDGPVERGLEHVGAVVRVVLGVVAGEVVTQLGHLGKYRCKYGCKDR